MPNIRSFEAPENLGLNPTDRGTDATAAAARRVGAFYNQVGDATQGLGRTTEELGRATQHLGAQTGQLGSAQKAMWDSLADNAASDIRTVGGVITKYEDHQQISAGAPAGAKVLDGLDNQWNAIAKNADPNDQSIRQKFLQEQVEPALEKFKEGFTTENSQAWAEHFGDQIRAHLYRKTAADQSELAGIAVKANYKATVNSLSSSVASDPSSLDVALKLVDHSIGAMVDSSPTLDAATAASVKSQAGQEAKESIVKAAVIGMITKNPNIDLDAIQKKYGEYIKGDEMKMFAKAALVQAKVDRLTAKQDEIAQRQLNERKAEKAANDSLTRNVAIDPQTGRPTIDPNYFRQALDIARMPDAPVGLARALIDWGEHQQNIKAEPVVSDAAAASAIDARMFSSDNPTSKMDILRAEADKKLSRADAEIRTKIIDQRDKMPSDPMFKIAMDGAKELIEGRTAGEKSLQSGKYAAFMQQFLGEYQRQKAAGTLPPNALSLRDPNSLLSKTMEAYKSPLAAAISGNGGIGVPAPAPRNDAMPAIPPANQRPAGSIYETPRGKMKWTGTGWVQP